ncbi:MAG: XdhC/CoxI family protein [Flavobacteriaceae bacterium]|nr:XdhC/CoxI family protein [Flavobacteriaceae bacterium]
MEIFNFLKDKIQENNKAMLLLVVQSSGSSPGRQGFKMGITINGEISGSIGGGVMEYNLVEEAKLYLKNTSFKPFLKKQIHQGEIVDGSGMICSGEQIILFKILDKSNLPTIKKILNYKTGILTITSNTFLFNANLNQSGNYYFLSKNDQTWTYSEKVNKKNKLYIIGAGHVGLATSEIFSKLDFEITLIDNRKDLNTLKANQFIDHVIISDYKEISQHIPENENSYITIMTNGFKTDKIALEKVLEKKLKYIGVLGSKAKLKIMFEVLKKNGFTEKQLQNIHAPIGLFIHSQTPMEIAISIAAQIIAVKNKPTN